MVGKHRASVQVSCYLESVGHGASQLSLLSLTHLVLDGYLDHNRMTNPHDLDPLSSLQQLQVGGWLFGPSCLCASPPCCALPPGQAGTLEW